MLGERRRCQMGRLKTRQERFCQRFVECANASGAARAARAAGYSPESARNAGYRLLRHPLIAARIAAIHAETARAACRDVGVLLGKLETVYRRSVDDHHFSTAARAVELQARLSGLASAVKPETGIGEWDKAWESPNNRVRGKGPALALSSDIILNRSARDHINDN